MEFHKEVLDRLACPRCKGPVSLDEKLGGFVCRACRLLFPIEDGIPNFLLEDARPLASKATEAE